MPRNAPLVKRNAVEHTYNANVILCDNTSQAREETAKKVEAETGAHFIAPYDNPYVIAGQGTMVLELLQDVENIDAIIAPVGGGGMLSGICVAAKGINPSIRIFGAEPKGADDAFLSLKEGKIIPQLDPRTIADGLRTSLGELTFPIIKVEMVFVLLILNFVKEIL